MSESDITMNERLQKLGQTLQEYRDTVVAHIKNMEVEIEDWNFAVGKKEDKYTVEVAVKVGIMPKSKEQMLLHP